MKRIEDIKMKLKDLRESKTEEKVSVHPPHIVIPFLNPPHTVRQLYLIINFNNYCIDKRLVSLTSVSSNVPFIDSTLYQS